MNSRLPAEFWWYLSQNSASQCLNISPLYWAKLKFGCYAYGEFKTGVCCLSRIATFPSGKQEDDTIFLYFDTFTTHRSTLFLSLFFSISYVKNHSTREKLTIIFSSLKALSFWFWRTIPKICLSEDNIFPAMLNKSLHVVLWDN